MSFSRGQLIGHICVDYGTSHSSISSTASDPKTGLDVNGRKPSIRVFDGHTSRPAHQQPNATTDIYFDPLRNRPLTGFELMVDTRYRYCELDPSRLFKHTKLLANNPDGNSRRLFDRLMEKAEELGKSRTDILDIFSLNFYEPNLSRLREQNEWKEPMETRLAIPVPAGWPTSAHASILEGFQKLADKYGINDIMLVTEPQAQILWYAHEKENRGEAYQPGDIVMVVDLGGGTTCMSLFEITRSDGSELIPLDKNLSISNGMEILLESFGDMVRQRLLDDALRPHFDIEHSVRHAIEQFDWRKNTFASQPSNNPTEHSVVIRRWTKNTRLPDELMSFNHGEIKSLFDHFFQSTLQGMKSIIPQGKLVTEIYFCGGGAQNPYLWDEMNRAFAPEMQRGLRLVRQEHSERNKFAVSHGGVLASLHASMGRDVVKNIVAQQMQSILILAERTVELHNHYSDRHLEYHTFDSDTGDEREYAFMLDHFVKKDESIAFEDKDRTAGFRDAKIGSKRWRVYSSRELKKEDLEIRDLLVIMDQGLKALGGEYDGASAVNVDSDNDGVITGLRDCDGNLLTDAKISHELCWALPQTYHQRYVERYKDIHKEWRAIVDYRLIMQVNDAGETKYEAEVSFKRPRKGKGRSRKLRFPATIRPIKAAKFDIMSMTKTCASTYDVPYLSMESEPFSPDFPHHAQSSANSHILPSNHDTPSIDSSSMTLTSGLDPPPSMNQGSPLFPGAQPDPYLCPAPSEIAIRALREIGGNDSGGEGERPDPLVSPRSFTAVDSFTSDDSIPASMPTLQSSHNRGPWSSDNPGLKGSTKRKRKAKQ